MFTSKYRWMAAFGTSVACHAVVFVVIGAVVALFPSTPVDKGPIEVELVSLSGGGGGGGGSPDADNGPAIAPPSAEPTEVAPPPPALAEDMPEDAMNDIHEIADSVTESKEAATKTIWGSRFPEKGNLQEIVGLAAVRVPEAVMDLDMAPEQGQVRVPAAVQVPVVEMVQEQEPVMVMEMMASLWARKY